MKVLQISSGMFGVFSAFIYYLGFPKDAGLLGVQCITAIAYHSTYNRQILHVDRATTFLLLIRSGYLAQQTQVTQGIWVSFWFYMYVIYGYGKKTNRFSFDPNKNIGDLYHASLHYLGASVYIYGLLCLPVSETTISESIAGV